jgi:hypothetical protein
MLDRDEVVRSLDGAWQLFLDRPNAIRRFDVSVDGFWRSFAAIVLVLPSYAFAALAERRVTLTDAIPDETFSDTLFVIDGALSLGLDWIMLPLLLAVAARRLGVARNYVAFVVARNWCTVIAALPFGVIGLLFLLDVIGTEAANFLSLVTLFVVLRYSYLVARRALGVSVALAGGLVVFDFVLSLTIALTVGGLLGS